MIALFSKVFPAAAAMLLGLGAIFLAVFPGGVMAQNADPAQVLHVYGPGGPYLPMSECAKAFSARSGVVVAVVKGEPESLVERMSADGDLYYTGAPYMMEDFIKKHPGLIDERSIAPLFQRRVGILVRKGNPKNIRAVADVASPGLMILDVRLENMYALRHDPENKPGNTGRAVDTGSEGLALWKSDAGLDAWVTYKSWYHMVQADSDFIPIDGPEGLRATPAALLCTGINKALAQDFLEFLRSEEARIIFRAHGWE
jgi:accessory colonization factor AcfC